MTSPTGTPGTVKAPAAAVVTGGRTVEVVADVAATAAPSTGSPVEASITVPLIVTPATRARSTSVSPTIVAEAVADAPAAVAATMVTAPVPSPATS